MPKDILMPALSPTMEEGKITKWNKKEGDKISSGDIIAEIETDKAVMEYEAVDEGTLGKILIKEGTEGVKVNSVIGVLLEEGEDKSIIETYLEKINEKMPPSTTKNIENIKPNSSKNNEYLVENTSKTVNFTLNNQDKSIVFITPLAKIIAKQNNLDIKNIEGTGPNGRIIKKDVLNYVEHKSMTPIDSHELSLHKEAFFSEVKNSSMRVTIAKRLLESKNTIPHYYLNIDCVVNDLLKAREDINNKSKDLYKISVNDFIIKAVGLAMRDVPEANSSWQGDKTRVFNRVDISVAVAIPNGLITPIIKNVLNKGLIKISKEMKDLAYRAKEGKLKPEEYQGGGFSISNLGMFGIKSFSAIINPPQSGILAIGATEKRPIVVNDNIVIANVLTITLSADHRVMDGAVGAKFLNCVKKYLENPVNMIL